MNGPGDKADPDQATRAGFKGPDAANTACNVQGQFELGERTRLAFGSGLTIEDTIADLTVEAMKLGFEPADAERLIRDFYGTCASRETPAEAITRCSKMDPMQYDRVRKDVAKRHGARPATLDAKVEAARAKNPAPRHDSLAPPQPEPWPDPVDGLALLNALRSFLARFIIMPKHSLTALSLWIVFTYLLDAAETSPRLAITSPTKRCGKTLLIELLSWLVFRPIASSNLSASAVFRTIDAEQCSLLLDEADAMPRKSERTEEIRGLLNSGHTRTSAYAIRNVKSGDDWVPKKFSTWAAIAVAAIGELPDTWADRSIAISMMRKPRKVTVERLIRRNTQARADSTELTRKIARWAKDHKEQELADATPELPSGLDDRACNNWELLLAIADAVGGAWPEMARKAAVELSGERGESGSLGEQLVTKLRVLFEERESDRLSSAEVCEFLATLEGEPWAEYGRARRPITPNQLARVLKRFHVVPRTIRLAEETAKGYLLSDLEEVFAVYTAFQTVTPSQPNEESNFGDSETVTLKSRVAADSSESAHGENECDGVTDRKWINERLDANGAIEIDRFGAADAEKDRDDSEDF